MGVGDDIMATGMARGAAARGKRIAFGDGKRIIWGPHSPIAFKNNPNIAPPGSERAPDIEWIKYHRGNRIYNALAPGKWIWNYSFKPQPGQLFFTHDEIERGRRFGSGFVVIEPNVPQQKSVRNNKQWPLARFQIVANALMHSRRVIQFHYEGATFALADVIRAKTDSLRDAFAILSNASLFIGHEGGLHHAAAALGVPAVVIFGGFIPPQVTGYDMHINLTGNSTAACGSLNDCEHCKQAMLSIHADDVLAAATSILTLKAVS